MLAACHVSGHKSHDGKLRVLATTGMIADAAKNIVRDSAEVAALMGAGVDPHLYKATQSDLLKLTRADVVLYNGLHLEGKMAEVLEKLARQKTVVAVSDGIPRPMLNYSEAFGDHPDPHIWFDVQLWRMTVQEMSRKLQSTDTVHAAFYAANAAQYLAQLDSLDTWVKQEMNRIPPQARVLITAHDAFGYFGRAYRVEVKGLQGISTVSEFGLRDVADLVNFICERKIKAVFVESSVPPRAIEAVIEGCRDKGHEVRVGGTLFSDAMGAAGTPEGTYIGMVQANVRTIVQALR
ncbi:manganese/zinc/iron transport system substrate-binding protein [Flexibacter flexilis DSM 6793]|uniref:Manganese/zinc/iron transport system substrate-binding protein n=2 Tax=Flexibacter flexilis TaxID=998 RepID=A0A1I1DAI6_9BACT|nr:manganese/zinc/iron transport system substrate-binding protein [Flexibacter flexilis DSM 6793]